MYADDTSAIATGETEVAAIESGNVLLGKLYSWFSANKLLLNPDKSFVLLFHSRQRLLSKNHVLHLEQNVLRLQDSVKFLGFQFTDTLSWKPHCDHLCIKLSKVLYQIRSLRDVIHDSVLRIFYFSYVQSRLMYGVLVWGDSAYSATVFLVQKRIMRCLAGIRYRDSCRPVFRAMRIMPLACLYILEMCIFVHGHKFEFDTRISHSYGTRCRLILPRRVTLCITENMPYFIGVKLYNKLPSTLTNLHGNMFKTRLKELLLCHCFYSVKEFFETNLL